MQDAGTTYMISALDMAAGLLTSSIVEIVAPPITDQSGIRLFVESALQLGTLLIIGREVSALIMKNQNDPTKGLAFQWSVFVGAPNTLNKIGLLGAWGRDGIKSIISNIGNVEPNGG